MHKSPISLFIIFCFSIFNIALSDIKLHGFIKDASSEVPFNWCKCYY